MVSHNTLKMQLGTWPQWPSHKQGIQVHVGNPVHGRRVVRWRRLGRARVGPGRRSGRCAASDQSLDPRTVVRGGSPQATRPGPNIVVLGRLRRGPMGPHGCPDCPGGGHRAPGVELHQGPIELTVAAAQRWVCQRPFQLCALPLLHIRLLLRRRHRGNACLKLFELRCVESREQRPWRFPRRLFPHRIELLNVTFKLRLYRLRRLRLALRLTLRLALRARGLRPRHLGHLLQRLGCGGCIASRTFSAASPSVSRASRSCRSRQQATSASN
eukprot:scaffold113112_cov62-Phaeocystis_antarctica.AAC.4